MVNPHVYFSREIYQSLPDHRLIHLAVFTVGYFLIVCFIFLYPEPEPLSEYGSGYPQMNMVPTNSGSGSATLLTDESPGSHNGGGGRLRVLMEKKALLKKSE
jgi:hypothetical protein